MSKYEDFISFVRAAVNRDIYLWGGGQPTLWTLSELTEQRIRNKETSASNADRVIKQWRERKDKYPDAYATDCSGGIIYCLMLAGLVSKSFDTTAHGLMSKCKKISKSELREGDWVGQKSSSGNVFHIGVVDRVDPDGQVWIDEWRGRDRGCVCTKIQDGASTWNVFGRPDWVYDATSVITKDPEPPKAEAFKLTRAINLTSPNTKGDDVAAIQRNLIGKGFSCGSTGADGIFGSGTRNAVIAFQSANGLTANGIVDKATCGKLGGTWEVSETAPAFTLFREIRYKSPLTRGEDIKLIQSALTQKGYPCGAIDGAYGTKTRDAVKAFQKANSLKVDGIVGKNTCVKLGGEWRG